MKLLALVLLVLVLSTPAYATVLYSYGCENNNISSANFTLLSNVSCSSTVAVNGSFSIKLPANMVLNATLWNWTAPTDYNITYFVKTNVNNATSNNGGVCWEWGAAGECWGAAGGNGLGWNGAGGHTGRYVGLQTGASTGTNLGNTTGYYVRYQKTGTNLSVFFNGVYVESATNTTVRLNWRNLDATIDGYIDDLCVWTGTQAGCYAAPTVPGLTLQLFDEVNGSVISGFCVNITSTNTTTPSQYLCNATGSTLNTNVTFVSGNISFVNITAGQGTTTYFNVSNNTVFFNQTMTVSGYSYQSVIRIYPQVLFLNTTAVSSGMPNSSFNITNGFAVRDRGNGSFVLGSPSRFFIDVPARNSTNNYHIDLAGNFSLNFTCPGLLLEYNTCNASGLYDALLKVNATDASTGGAVTTFSVSGTNTSLGTNNVSTTNGTAYVPLLLGYYYFFFADAAGYAYGNVTINMNQTTQNYTFGLTLGNVIAISFYDETTGALLTHENVTLQYIGTSLSGSNTTNTGRLNITLAVPDTYTLIADAPSYLATQYQFVLVNRSFNSLNLTLLNSSVGSTVTITVKDTLDNPVAGQVVKILRYDIVANTYELIQVRTTNFEGVTTASMVLNDPLYKFIVERDGVVVLATEGSQIYSTTLTLVIDPTPNAFSTVFTQYLLSGNVRYTNTSYQCSFTYNDESNTATQGCITAYTLAQTRTQYNQSCSASAAGTVNVTLLNSSGTAYVCIGTITDSSGEERFIDQVYATFGQVIPSGAESPIMMFLVFITFVTAFLAAGIEVAVIVGSFIPLLFTAMQLSNLSYTVTIPVFFGGLVLAYIIGMVRR